jgi:predicted extracellular nuclease
MRYGTPSPVSHTSQNQKPHPARVWLLIFTLLLALPDGNAKTAESLTPCQIQGTGKVTPYNGEQVQTEGIVTADFDNQSERGFFIQIENCDDNGNTSNGLFVYLNEMANVVSVGDWVTVNGLAEEDFGLTRINTTPAGVSVLSSGNTLPLAVDFAPPFDNEQAKDYFERHESMRVQAADTVVVGPTSARGYAYVIRAGLGLTRVFQGDPAGTGEIIPISSDGVYQIEPDAQVGDQLSNVVGVLNYTGGEFGIMLTGFPTLIRPPLVVAHASALLPHSRAELQTTVHQTNQPTAPFSLATLNLHNLFDTLDDPNTDDSIRTPGEYQTHLKKLALTLHELGEPLFIAVQEAENNTVLQALANRPELDATYSYLWQDSVDRRGIDVALLYQANRVNVIGWELRQGCTPLVDGLGPDGNGDVLLPANALTCDTDGDGENDGNRLFSRPPLVAHVQVCEGPCGSGGAVRDLWIIAVHFKSKSEDTDFQPYTLPRRIAQAQFVAGLDAEIVGSEPGAEVIAAGDFNDYPDSQPLQILTGAGLSDLVGRVPAESAYTYIFQGVSQIMDHILVSPGVLDNTDEALVPTIFHLNADYPVSWEGDDSTARRATDHDPVVLRVGWGEAVWLPVVMRP